MDDLSDLSPEVLLAHSASGLQDKTALQCCCGKPQCAFLEHSSSVLEGLEKDLLLAARTGQALLTRHESHMAEAEAERIKMSATIDKLEDDKKGLEESNAKVIAENRELLDQLEDLNNQVCDSDAEVQALTATLQSTQQELQKLNHLASRAAELETQLTELEVEQAGLHTQFTNSQDQTKAAVQRWKRAESTIAYLQEQVDSIEREAKEERERHVEVLGRLERRRDVERELEKAAGRLKGAAAAKSFNDDSGDTNVVSHFVRDILQDNANLQMGVMELREMLVGSNTEVENLREQLVLHQPLEPEASTLNTELDAADSSAFETIPELHVHHHYHRPEKTVRKPKKKRAAIASGHFTPAGSTTPRQQRVREWRTSTSSANTILSQTSATVPSNRWSVQSSQTGSSFAPSSIPSSPYRSSSVFDPIDAMFESRPTSPEMSVSGTSPQAAKEKPKLPTDPPATYRSFSAPIQSPTSVPKQADVEEDHMSNTGGLEQDMLASTQEIIPEEVELDDSTVSPGPSISSFSQRRHRRAASHESLFSLAGGSARPLRQQLSQNFDITGRGFSPITATFSPTSPSFAAEPTISHATATARKTPSRPNTRQDSDSALSLLSQASGTPPTKAQIKKPSAGWAWGKWGKTPILSNSSRKTPQSPLEAALRSPGVNQTGFIKGIVPPKPAPINIEPQQIDESSLREALSG